LPLTDFSQPQPWFSRSKRPVQASERLRESGRTRIQIHGIVVVLLILGIWLLVAFLIDPRGEFPLNDDWCYAAAVKALRGGAGLKLQGCVSTNIVAQVVWGALFCLPFGFSFTALRISTLTLGVIGAVGLYGLLRELDADQETALFGALLLAFNPLYLVLSYTFMPDVPFVAVSISSFYFLVRGLKRDRWPEVAAGLCLACAALLIRQNGLAIFIAFGLAYLAKSGLRLRTVLLAVVSVAVGGAVQLLWQLWLKHKDMLPSSYSKQADWVLSTHLHSWRAAEPIALALIIIPVYVGLFLLPLLLFVGKQALAEFNQSRLLTWAAFGFALVAAWTLRYRRMPLLQNVFYDFGLGPPTLRDTYILTLPSLPTAGKSFWSVVTFLGFLGAVVWVQATLVAAAKALKLLPFPAGRRVPLVLLLAAGFIYFVPVALLTFYGRSFDRYLLFLMPLAIAIIVLLLRDAGPGHAVPSLRLLASASLILYAAFAIAGTHDYLAWNRARWQGLNDLAREQRVSADDIDGGYEFNSWYLYDSRYLPTPGKSGWYVFGDDYVVTFGPLPHYAEFKRYPFRRWLPPSQGNILVLRRSTPVSFR
jgi:hypothetical protein